MTLIISSLSLVSSRQRDILRPPPSVSRRSSRVSRSLWGASCSSIVLCSVAKTSRRFRLSDFFTGRKPSKQNLAVASPESVRAQIPAHAPGIAVTGIPLSAHSATRSSPGSDIAGVPASVTRAQDSPDSRRRAICNPRSALLCSKYDTRGREMPKCVSIRRVFLVSSAAIKSTSDSTLSARSLISARFPIGVDTRYSVPPTILFFSSFLISVQSSPCFSVGIGCVLLFFREKEK